MPATPSENPLPSLLGCLMLAGLFVMSLYIWPPKYGRNHPTTIKQRFCSVFFVVIISPIILKFFVSSSELKQFSVFELIGLRLPGLLPAAIYPLLLTMVLFLGPLSMVDYKNIYCWVVNFRFWIDNFTNLIWLRNVIVGPLSEEFTYRACMMPLLMQCFSPLTAVFVCSFFFGVAHVHHVIERYKAGDSLKMIIVRAIVQFSYTTLFGGYSAYLFIRTAHFISVFMVHSFCNVMALPDFGKLYMYQNPKRSILMCLFVLGVILWYNLLDIMTSPKIYSNNIFFGDEVTA
ncbi:hypothetical protein RUM43_004591 [Polyplax serrata]